MLTTVNKLICKSQRKAQVHKLITYLSISPITWERKCHVIVGKAEATFTYQKVSSITIGHPTILYITYVLHVLLTNPVFVTCTFN